jgi:excisionase family DNA binding protein
VIRLLTAQELADYLGIHRETVYSLTHEGKIPGHKVGALWRYDPDEVLEALQAA